ncbi:MAG: 6-carboxytetrahydropterin synthase [Phycisphaeraceae bacterium]
MTDSGTYAITVRTVFAASHALRLANGDTEPLHGHNWDVLAEVSAIDLDRMQAVMDFHDVQNALADILKPWNNRHLNDCPPFVDGTLNPTAERVAWAIAQQLIAAMPEGVQVTSVAVGEAPGCTAIYRP